MSAHLAPVNVTLRNVLELLFPAHYAERVVEAQQERAMWDSKMPVFCMAQPLFPGQVRVGVQCRRARKRQPAGWQPYNDEATPVATLALDPWCCVVGAAALLQPLSLHLFEPRYRLMMERMAAAPSSTKKRFCYLATPEPAEGAFAPRRAPPVGRGVVSPRGCQ